MVLTDDGYGGEIMTRSNRQGTVEGDNSKKLISLKQLKKMPLKDLLSEEMLLQQSMLARVITEIFVGYKVDDALQTELRERLKLVLSGVACECFKAGYDSGHYKGTNEGIQKGEQQAVLKLHEQMEEEIAKEILNLAPQGPLH